MGRGAGRWRWPRVVGVVVVVLVAVAMGAQPGAPGEVRIPVPPVRIEASPEAVEAVLRGRGIPATEVQLGTRAMSGWPPAYSFDTVGVAFTWDAVRVRSRIELSSGLLTAYMGAVPRLAGDIATEDATTAARVADEWFALVGVPLARSRLDFISSVRDKAEWHVLREQVLPNGVATPAYCSVGLDGHTGALTSVAAAPWLADDTRLPTARISAEAAVDRVLAEYGAGARSNYRGVSKARLLRVQRGIQLIHDDGAEKAIIAWEVELRAEAVPVYFDGLEGAPTTILVDASVDEQSGELLSYHAVGIDTLWLAEEVLGADEEGAAAAAAE
mgnify:FL=1